VSLWANKLSSTAFDFTGAHVLGTYTNVTPFSESSATDHTAPRLALTTLAGVREITIGKTYLTNSNSQLAVTLRAVEHRTTGLCRIRAWIPGGTTNFAPQTLAWASLNYSLGTVVSLSAIPDVADDKNINAAKRTQLRLSRTGTPAALAATLNAYVRIPTNGIHELTSPVDRRQLIANYGTSPTNDYSFGTPTGGTLGTVTPGGVTQVTFDANSTSVVIPILPKADNFTEANAIRVDLVATNTDAPGPSTLADIYTVGLATWANLYGQTQQHGAVWTWQSTAPATDLGLTFQPHGISFRPTTLAADRAWIVGAWGNSAYQVLDNNSSGVTLPHFASFSGSSLAWAISPNGARTVGYSTSLRKRRPALWVGTENPSDLSSGMTDPMRIGEAKAVNNAGVIVGYSTGFPSNPSHQRPFRNSGNGATFSDTDWMAVPAGGTGEGTANAITTSSSKHYVSGWHRRDDLFFRIAASWSPASSQTLPSVAVELGRLSTNGNLDARSESTSINSSLIIVRWSGSSETSSDRRAVLFNDGVWKDLNDRHFIHSSTSWILQSAKTISDSRVIVGVGLFSGSPRGFMLISRIAGN